jgi:excisionase family DNA binding protein
VTAEVRARLANAAGVGRGPVSEPMLMTVEEAAAQLAVPVSWLKQRVAAHAIACTRLGRHIRFTREQLGALVAASEQPVARAPLTGLTRRSRRPA